MIYWQHYDLLALEDCGWTTGMWTWVLPTYGGGQAMWNGMLCFTTAVKDAAGTLILAVKAL